MPDVRAFVVDVAPARPRLSPSAIVVIVETRIHAACAPFTMFCIGK
jgi:hypothetical protein